MSRLEIKRDDNWTYFKHGKRVYRISYYEMGTIEDWVEVSQ